MIFCLHGFLGDPSDWQFLADAGLEVSAPALFWPGSGPSSISIGKLADSVAEVVTPDDVLAGYSMGGRIALEALCRGARPKAAVIVSAGLGVEGDAERAARRAADERWAARFEREAWPEVLRDWNAQPVLAGGAEPPREESSYSRAALAMALREWSPAVQQPLAVRLGAVDVPLFWIAGERDAKYVAEATRACALAPRAELVIAAGSGHRVLWDAPDVVLETVRRAVG